MKQDKLKKEILEEFEKKFCPIEELKPNQDKWAIDVEVFMAVKDFIDHTIDRARQEERGELVEKLKEDERGDTPSKNENVEVESMYDFIVGQIFGLYEKGKEIKESADLREAIRRFGKMRYNQAIDDTLKTPTKKEPTNK